VYDEFSKKEFLVKVAIIPMKIKRGLNFSALFLFL